MISREIILVDRIEFENGPLKNYRLKLTYGNLSRGDGESHRTREDVLNHLLDTQRYEVYNFCYQKLSNVNVISNVIFILNGKEIEEDISFSLCENAFKENEYDDIEIINNNFYENNFYDISEMFDDCEILSIDYINSFNKILFLNDSKLYKIPQMNI